LQLTPVYGDRPIISVESHRPAVHRVISQRRRLEGLLGALSEDEWTHPSRCEGWSVHDVVTHLVSTNTFWAISIQSGLAGQPTRFLADFDPMASPAQLVAAQRGRPAAATLEQFIAGNTALAEVVGAVRDDDWDRLAEAPPGHVPIRLVADHALWDAWVHERDIALALGRSPTVEVDEVIAALRYCAALGPAFMLSLGTTREGAAEVVVSDPSDRFVVAIEGDHVRVHAGPAPEGAPVLRTDAVGLLEALSIRAAGPASPVVSWLSAGLAAVFDRVPSG